jgi:hypothetical protein
MFRFASVAMIAMLQSAAVQARQGHNPKMADFFLSLTNPQRDYRPSKRGAHKYGKKPNMRHVSKRTKRRHRRSA